MNLLNKIFYTILAFFCLTSLCHNSLAQNIKLTTQQGKILDIRSKEYSDHIRFVVELSKKNQSKILILHDPERIVLDVKNTSHLIEKNHFKAGQTIDSIRTGKFNTNSVRLVLDLNNRAEVKKHFILKPSETNKNWRVVVDITKNKKQKEKQLFTSETTAQDLIGELIVSENLDTEVPKKEKKETLDDLIAQLEQTDTEQGRVINKPDSVRKRATINDSNIARPTLKPKFNRFASKTTRITPSVIRKKGKYIIVVDAGHGGKDPGAVGRRRKTKEKTITLEFAKELKNTLENTGKYKVYLTRKNDKFISLGSRVKIARKRKGDLFISIHADSGYNKKARGLSIYTLSQRASDTRTAKLAKKENKSDIIGGMNLYGEYQSTINVLVDLSRREVMNSSSKLAEAMLREIRRNKIRTLSNGHKYGNFAVLLAPDMPSMLIELGFLSNRSDEKMLKSKSYRRKVCKVITNGINKYFK